MSIEMRNETEIAVDQERVLRLTNFALDSMRVHPDAELEIMFYDEKAMEELHIKFMDEPGPTDVMSFPMDELHPGTPEELSGPGDLGSIVVCPSVAAAQAVTAGHEAINEILLLVTHGVLHLLGYDHAEEDERVEMFGIQDRILAEFYAQEA